MNFHSYYLVLQRAIGGCYYGRVEERFDLMGEQGWEKKLKTNLMYAHEALDYTKKALPFGAVNYSSNLKGASVEAILALYDMRTEIESRLKRVTLTEVDEVEEIIAEVAKKYKVGNCHEQAVVAYIYLKQEKNIRKIETFRIINGDHIFVVIGRDPLSEIANPLTWGKVAVVCDPWLGSYFPARCLYDKFSQSPDWNLYDPNKHSIGLRDSGCSFLNECIYKPLDPELDRKTFVREHLDKLPDTNIPILKKIEACLKNYLKMKESSKLPPTISKEGLQKVERIFLDYTQKDGEK